MKNLLNIEDQVKINMPGTCADGRVVKVTSMQQFKDGKILYIGTYHVECSNGGEGFDTTVQFGEGQYEAPNSNNKINNGRELSIKVNLDGIDTVKNQLGDLEVQLDRIVEKIKMVTSYNN